MTLSGLKWMPQPYQKDDTDARITASKPQPRKNIFDDVVNIAKAAPPNVVGILDKWSAYEVSIYLRGVNDCSKHIENAIAALKKEKAE